jgi:integrase
MGKEVGLALDGAVDPPLSIPLAPSPSERSHSRRSREAGESRPSGLDQLLRALLPVGSPPRHAPFRLGAREVGDAKVQAFQTSPLDAEAGVLRVRESKFHKSRWVPLSADARRELRRYLKHRLVPALSAAPTSSLLCNLSRGQRGYTGNGLRDALHRLLLRACIRDAEGRVPRIHDFRHTFAVQALLRWYRQGVYVQSNLPKLALYMGHVSIVSTAYYLRWISETQGSR